jgi:hypothetical protein
VIGSRSSARTLNENLNAILNKGLNRKEMRVDRPQRADNNLNENLNWDQRRSWVRRLQNDLCRCRSATVQGSCAVDCADNRFALTQRSTAVRVLHLEECRGVDAYRVVKVGAAECPSADTPVIDNRAPFWHRETLDHEVLVEQRLTCVFGIGADRRRC